MGRFRKSLSRLLLSCAAVGWATIAVTADEAKPLKDVTYLIITSAIEPTLIPYGLLGEQKGWFKEEGLNVTLQTVSTGGQALQLLLANQAQIAFIHPETLILSSQTGETKIKMFYPLVRKQVYQAIVKEGSSIKDYCGLVGKTAGVAAFSKSIDAYINTRLVQDCGQSPDTVKLVETGFGVSSAQALESGSIDAFISFPTLFVGYENAGYKFNRLASAPWQSGFYGTGYAARADYMTQNPDVIEKFSRVLAKSAVYVRANPEDSVRALWAAFPQRAPSDKAKEEVALKGDVAILKETMNMMRVDEFPPQFAWGSQDSETWQRHLDLLKATNQLPQDFTADAEDFFTNDYNSAANQFDRDAVIEDAEQAR